MSSCAYDTVSSAAHRPRRVGDDGLDPALDALAELLAARREHLDAVVLERVVRRGDDDAGVEAVRCASDRPRRASAPRRRWSTSAPSPHSPRASSRSIHSPDSRVSRPTSTRIVCAGRLPPAHQRRADPRHRLLIERRLARLAANAIRSEQFHRFTAAIVTVTVVVCGARTRTDGVGHANGHDLANRCLEVAHRHGSVIASFSCFSALSGPATSTVSGSDRHADHLESRAPAAHRSSAAPAPSGPPTSRTPSSGSGGHLHDLDAVRHVHLSGRQVEQPPARPRGPQVDHRRHVASGHPAERARRAAHAHLDGVRRIADDLESGRQVLELDAARAARARRPARRPRPATAGRRCRSTGTSGRGCGRRWTPSAQAYPARAAGWPAAR